jgi:hypothetical protein
MKIVYGIKLIYKLIVNIQYNLLFFLFSLQVKND